MFFEGLYFKQQSERDMLALIPAVHGDEGGRPSVSLQAVMKDRTLFLEWPGRAARIDRRGGRFEMDGGVFSKAGICLNVQNGRDSLSGHLRFVHAAPPRGDIMGPYRFVPFLECRHSVFSLTHGVAGSLTVNGRIFDFTDGTGYIEGDRGRAFPKRYVWTQVNWFDRSPCSLMLSCAEVCPLGRHFIGVIGFVLYRGRQITLASYRGAQVVKIGGGAVTVRQGDMVLSAQLRSGLGHPLRAPASGGMTRLIRESLACRVRYIFTIKGRVAFDMESDQAGFEDEFPSGWAK